MSKATKKSTHHVVVDSKPDFIERGGEILIRQPVVSWDTTLYGFVYESTQSQLQSLIDGALNVQADRIYNYRAASSRWLLTFTNLRGASSKDPEHRQMGITTELNLSIWIPTIAVRRGENDQTGVAERLTMYIPYMFVDNQYSLVSGRETYGFPKSWGQNFQFPHAVESLSPISVDTYALKRFHPDEMAKVQRVLEIKQHKCGDGPWDDISDGIRSILFALYDGESISTVGFGMLEDIANLCFNQEFGTVFLKQTRCPENPTKADLQAIVEATATTDKIRNGGLLPGGILEVSELASHPIARDLGIPKGGLDSEVAFWVDFDFTLQKGCVVQSWST